MPFKNVIKIYLFIRIIHIWSYYIRRGGVPQVALYDVIEALYFCLAAHSYQNEAHYSTSVSKKYIYTASGPMLFAFFLKGPNTERRKKNYKKTFRYFSLWCNSATLLNTLFITQYIFQPCVIAFFFQNRLHHNFSCGRIKYSII